MIGKHSVPPPPPSPPSEADVDARQREYATLRWQRALADYRLGVELGAIAPGGDPTAHVVAIYAAYSIADAQS